VPRSGVGKAGNAEVDEAAGKAPASSGVVEGQVSPEKSEALEKPSSSEPHGVHGVFQNRRPHARVRVERVGDADLSRNGSRKR